MNYRVIYPQDLNSFSENCETSIYTMYTIRVYTLYFLFIDVFVDLRCNDIIIGFH